MAPLPSPSLRQARQPGAQAAWRSVLPQSWAEARFLTPWPIPSPAQLQQLNSPVHSPIHPCTHPLPTPAGVEVEAATLVADISILNGTGVADSGTSFKSLIAPWAIAVIVACCVLVPLSGEGCAGGAAGGGAEGGVRWGAPELWDKRGGSCTAKAALLHISAEALLPRSNCKAGLPTPCSPAPPFH